MMSEKAKMKIGFQKNEKEFNPILKKTYTSVMQSINNQKQSHKTQMQKILQQKKIVQSRKPPSILDELKTGINAKKKMGLLTKD